MQTLNLVIHRIKHPFNGPLLASLLLLAGAMVMQAQSPTVDDFNPSPYSFVKVCVPQSDGKILAGGSFFLLGGQARNYIGRLNADGSLDTAFNPGADNEVSSLAQQSDGKILVGGGFTNLGGQARSYIGRLNEDGSLDTTFNPGANERVYALALQPDGRILVGGGFTTLGGQTCHYIGRLYADGSLDTTFNPEANGSVATIALQGDGKILVGGWFTMLGGAVVNCVGRLNADGSLDTTFNPEVNGNVGALAVQADGKILVGGYFTQLGGQVRSYLGRLNADGSLDATFNAGLSGGNSPYVNSLALQADGKILAGGNFTTLGGQTHISLGRLNADGSLDTSFTAGLSGTYSSADSLALQADGKILVGGYFTTLGGQTRNSLGRLNATDPASQSLGFDGATITWLRGGTSPEVWRTSFEQTTDGLNWSRVGAGTRQTNGWRLAATTVLPGATLRARGYVAGGGFNGSGYIVESFWGAPKMMVQPRSCTNVLGTSASFSITVAGSPLLSYQWRMDGTNLPGQTNSTLSFTNVQSIHAGGYDVVVTNALGAITSSVATLSIPAPPEIVAQPQSCTNLVDTAAVLSASATGAMPLSYQWRFNGANLPDQTNSALSLSKVQLADAGDYDVVVTNVAGAITSSVATLTVWMPPSITTQPQSGTNFLGASVSLSVTATGTTPLSYQWQLGGTNLTGATASSYTITNAQSANAGDYTVIVTNVVGSVTSFVASLTIVVPSPIADEFNPGADGAVYVTVPLPNGKILVGGDFTMLGGQLRRCLGRLNADGSVDGTFNLDANGRVYALAVQPDGKILVGGDFTMLGGRPCNHLGRIRPDGSQDTTFVLGTDGNVYSLVLQPDGKILLGGAFRALDGQSRSCLGRLNADGSLDSTFNPEANNYVCSLALQPDGKILVGGGFSALGGRTRNCLGRLNTDGTLDSAFDPGAGGSTYPAVQAIALQADGKILVGGNFTTLGGQPCPYLGRLSPDGTLDQTFAGGATTIVYSLALQADGKILAGGFSTLGGQARTCLSRLNPDGSLDGTFNQGTDGWVNTVAVQADGKILVGGYFTALRGQMRNNLGRLAATDPAAESLSANGSAITWLRGGTSPEVWRTTFGQSVDGTNWENLGEGVRLTNGWRVTGTAVPPGVTVRARGYVSGGYNNGSSWYVESGLGAPVIVLQPLSCSNEFGTTASFSTAAAGAAPLSYQWRFGGAMLPGQTDSTLLLSTVQVANGGDYDVVVTNPTGSVTSSVATLTVWMLPATITAQPQSRTNLAGTAASFGITGIGTAPLSYQWRFGGTNLLGGTNSILSLGNVQSTNAGDYDVVVTNIGGAITSSVATLTVWIPPTITAQPLSSTNLIGTSASFSVTATGTEPLSYQWRLGGTNLIGATASTYSISSVGYTDAGDYTVIVTNVAGKVTSAAVRLTVPAAPTADEFNPSPNGYVYTTVIQPDGKILVGGIFYQLGKQSRSYLGRLDPDGSLDTTFNPGANGPVYSLSLQPDGKVLVGGNFTTLAGVSRSRLGRLNANDSLDTSFNPGPASGSVYCLALQPDGKILVGGYFNTLAGVPRNNLGRLNANGSLDTTFNPGAVSGPVYCLALQPDGKILVGGDFTKVAGVSRSRLGRLNANGSLETTFNPGAGSSVYTLTVQPDGRILVGGNFTTLAGQSRNYLGRLNADGSLDATFDPGANAGVNSLALQADGSILVGGNFVNLGGQFRNHLGRLNADGSLDAMFNPGALSWVNSLGVQADGKILVGGNFSLLSGQGRSYLGRLNASEPATQSLSYDGSVITWARGGTSPAVWRTTFEQSTNGTDWVSLGAGTYQTNGWQVANAAVPSGATIRARGYVAGGYYNGSGWFVETCLGVPLIVSQPLNATNVIGTNLLFSVSAVGTAPLSYQWRLGGTSLPGQTNSVLSLTNIQSTGAGSYDVVVTNVAGAITSSVATLTVVTPPSITAQPQSCTNLVGSAASFSVSVSSAAAAGYHWRFRGVRLVGQTNATFVLSNVQSGNAGAYDVVVTNMAGAITSSVATLTVWVPPTILAQPQSYTNVAGTPAFFSIYAAGTAPLTYQWCLGGSNLSGATASTFTMAHVRYADAGDYTVIVNNPAGSVTSSVACLTVIASPVPLSIQPGSMVRLGDGQCQFEISGGAGQVLEIQGSTNLVDWGVIGNVILSPEGMTSFTAPASEQTLRFYRIKAQ